MEEEFIEGRMDIEKNDYGPTTSNPVHTPRPPRSWSQVCYLLCLLTCYKTLVICMGMGMDMVGVDVI